MNPSVSVILPNYNHARYLPQRIESILQQTYEDFELILLDDCSSDNSVEIMQRYSRHPKVSHFIVNTQNSGSTFHQWEKGIQMAKGEFIWMAESDDYASPLFLEKIMREFTAHPDAVLVYTGSQMIDAEGNPIEKDWDHYTEQTPTTIAYTSEHFLQRMIWADKVYNASMAVFRKECITGVPRLYSTFRYCGDWFFWSAIGRQGGVIEICEKLNYFRQHSQKVSPGAEKEGLYFMEGGQIKLLLMEWLGLTEAQRLVIRGKLWKQLRKAARRNPSLIRKATALYPPLYGHKWKAICYYLSDKWLNWSGLQDKRVNP